VGFASVVRVVCLTVERFGGDCSARKHDLIFVVVPFSLVVDMSG